MLAGERLNSTDTARLKLRQLAGPPRDAGGDGLESGGLESGRLEVGAPLDNDRRKDSVEKLRAVLAERVVDNDATPLGAEEAAVALAEADEALRRLSDAGEAAELTAPQEIMLEAVIEVDGSRPSIPVVDGTVDPDNPKIGSWRDRLVMELPAVQRAIASTGRLIRGDDLSEQRVYGTAWVVGPGLVATAQHVLETLYILQGGAWVERFGAPITVDFNVEAGRPPQPGKRCRVTGVAKASPDRIEGILNLANLDVAILQLADDGPAHPPPLVHAADIAPHGDPRIHIVGHPARPTVPAGDPNVPLDTLTAMTTQVLDLVFGDEFGVKRWSPGEFLTHPGTLPGDVNARVMTHDASTLGGNSGSPVFDFVSICDRVVGLHFAGSFREANYLHPTARVAAHLGLPGVTIV